MTIKVLTLHLSEKKNRNFYFKLTKRDKKQEEIVNIVVSKAKELKGIHHSIVVGTGIGKSKITMDIIKQLDFLDFKKILIVVDNTRLRDYNWKDDFIKWGLGDFYEDRVEMNTYQTVYKWSKNLDEYLIIADECLSALNLSNCWNTLRV